MQTMTKRALADVKMDSFWLDNPDRPAALPPLAFRGRWCRGGVASKNRRGGVAGRAGRAGLCRTCRGWADVVRIVGENWADCAACCIIVS